MKTIKSIVYYFFDTVPGQNFEYYTEVLILASILVIGGLAFSAHYKKRKKHDFAFKRLFKKVSKHSITLGVVLVILAVLRYEQIPYFSMRLWLYITLLLVAALIYRNIYKFKKVYPIEKINSKKPISNKKLDKIVYSTGKKHKKKKKQ